MKTSSGTPPPLYNNPSSFPLGHSSVSSSKSSTHTSPKRFIEIKMSHDEDYHLHEDDSLQYPEDYRGYEHLESSLLPFFSSPTKKTAQKEGLPSVPTSTAEHTRNNTTTAAVKAESEIKREMDERAIPVEVKAEASLKEEVKEEVKEETPVQEPLHIPELSGEEDEEEVGDDNPKFIRARRKIRGIHRRADPQAKQSQLFRKFKCLVRAGNCQGAMIDAVWDEWKSVSRSSWDSYDDRVHKLKARMYERRHYYEWKAAW